MCIRESFLCHPMNDIFVRRRFCHSLTHSATHSAVSSICNRWLSSAGSVQILSLNHFGFIYFPVKIRQTSAKYPSAGNAKHGIFQLKNESIYPMSQ